jgi:hypothetical protein
VTETSSAATKLKFIKKSVDISPTIIQHENVGDYLMDRDRIALGEMNDTR